MGTIRYGSFEWDEAKAGRNRGAHSLTFEDAAAVLTYTRPELHLVEYDDAHSDVEDRYVTIAPHPDDPDILLWVCWTERDDEDGTWTRLISARLATPREERRYARWRAGGEGGT